MLVRMLYASCAAAPLTEAVILEILEQSRRNNPPRGITGILCADREQFIQVLEGGRDEVCDLYNTITRDARHTRVRILVYEEISKRSFGSWTMGQVDIERVSQSLLLKYAERADLTPFAASGQASMALLDELIATGAVMSRGG